MGVYIKGMEMPTSCDYCPFEYKNYCMAKPSLKVESADRHPRCPLIPIPPHGRLIDANNIGLTDFEIIICQKENPFKNAFEMLLKKIENAPAIIPPKEDET